MSIEETFKELPSFQYYIVNNSQYAVILSPKLIHIIIESLYIFITTSPLIQSLIPCIHHFNIYMSLTILDLTYNTTINILFFV